MEGEERAKRFAKKRGSVFVPKRSFMGGGREGEGKEEEESEALCKKEKYHPVKGLFREYELIYVWATERDVIGVRTLCRKHSVTHLFKAVVLGPGNERRMLESYLKRTNDLARNPEWYNTITNTCTTNIVRHVNEVYPKRVPRAISILMPGLSPKMLERANLIEMKGTLEETLAACEIDEKAKSWNGEDDFGDVIRA